MFLINYATVHRTITEQLLESQTFIIAFLYNEGKCAYVLGVQR
jgi:hypothetical protein